jgi:uncharacterized protein YkwD
VGVVMQKLSSHTLYTVYMTRRVELIEDIFLIIGIVIVFGTVFSVTLAFKDTEPQPTQVVYASTPRNTDSSEKAAPIRHIAAVGTHLEEPQETQQPAPVETPMEEEEEEEEADIPEEEVKKEVLPPQKIITEAPVATISAPASVTTVTRTDSKQAFMQELASLIEAKTNAFRKKNGLSSLKWNSTLAQNAQAHSKQMLSEDFFSHTNPDGCDFTCRFEASGYAALTWGENLGQYSFSDFPRAESVASYFMSGWQKSAGHRENLLGDAFTNQGIGIAMDNGTIYVTVDFAQPMP